MSREDNQLGFSPAQAATLAALLDAVIPPSADGRLPGAGSAGVGAYIERTLVQTPELRGVIEHGVATADELAVACGARSFAELGPAQRSAVLEQLESVAPALLSNLSFPTFIGYYQTPAVIAALGAGSDPPHPKGYHMEPTDWSLLDPVRRRAKMYRE